MTSVAARANKTAASITVIAARPVSKTVLEFIAPITARGMIARATVAAESLWCRVLMPRLRLRN
jgi:hypothetical protein